MFSQLTTINFLFVHSPESVVFCQSNMHTCMNVFFYFSYLITMQQNDKDTACEKKVVKKDILF